MYGRAVSGAVEDALVNARESAGGAGGVEGRHDVMGGSGRWFGSAAGGLPGIAEIVEVARDQEG